MPSRPDIRFRHPAFRSLGAALASPGTEPLQAAWSWLRSASNADSTAWATPHEFAVGTCFAYNDGMQRGCVLPREFFGRPADRVARELLGQWLVVRGRGGRPERHVVFETEAYLGAHDLACHGSKGMTKRNATMFGPAGRWYVYLCYGMHWMLNVVTGAEGVPAAVLIRGVGDHAGPGRVTRALGIDRSFDDTAAARRTGLWFEAGAAVPGRLVQRTPRIGVGYAGAWAAKPLRFVVDPAAMPYDDGHSRRRTR